MGDDTKEIDAAPPPIDAPDIDAPPPFATGPFGAAMKVSVSSTALDDDVTLTGDMLEIYFESDRATAGQSDIYMARRAKVTDAWSLPAKVAELSTPSFEGSVNISTDGLTIYFASDRMPSTNNDYYVSTRPDRLSPWTMPERLTTVSDATKSDYDAQPWGNNMLYLASSRSPATGGSDIWRSMRTGSTWGMPALVPGLDTGIYEGEPFADATGAVWFTSIKAGNEDIWYAKSNGDGTYQMATVITEICGPAMENDAWLSPDGHAIYFTSDRGNTAGSLDIYMATR